MSDEVPILAAPENCEGAPPEPNPPGASCGNNLSSRRDDDEVHRAAAPVQAARGAQELRETITAFAEVDAPPFESLKTKAYATAGICLSFVMIVLVFLLPILCNDPHGAGAHESDSKDWLCKVEPFSVLIYTHALHWVVHLVVDQVLKSKHKTSRIQGYCRFYLHTKNTRRTPFYLVSFGNALLMVTITILHDYCDPNHCRDKFTKVDYLRGLITLESLIIISLWTYYIIQVNKFNKAQPRPDCCTKSVLEEILGLEYRLAEENDYDEQQDDSPGVDHLVEVEVAPSGNITTRRPNEPLRGPEEILELQAEIIRYLQTQLDRQSAQTRRMRLEQQNINAPANEV